MPGKKKLSPEDWMEEIWHSLEYRRQFGVEDQWGEMEAIYYNVHPSMANDGPNVFLSSGDSMLSTVTVPDPKILVSPRVPEAVAKSKILESLDNLLLIELEVKEQMEKAALHAYLFGRGILKVGYDSEFGFDPKLDIAGDLRLGMSLTQVDKKGRRRIEHNRLVTPGMPWVRAVPPHDFVVPWGTIELDNCPWIANRIVRHIDDIKADPKYKNTERLQPQLSMQDFVHSYRNPVRVRQRTSIRDPAYVEMWEIYDRESGRIKVVADNYEKFLRNDVNALQVENRLPFVAINFTPVSRAFWVTPDAFYLLHAQLELSDIAVQRTKQRRISALRFLYDEGVISEAELDKILSPDVGAAAKIETGQKISEAVMKLDNHPDQFLTLEEEHTRRNVREQLGFSRNQLGEFSGGRRTATEAGIVDKSSQLRMSRRALSVRRAYERVIETINGIIFEHWTTPRYVEVMGQQRTSEWLQARGPDLKSRFAYEVVFTDAQEEQARGLQALQLYQLLSQDPLVDPLMLREYLINQLNDPMFERVFNADIRNALSGLRAGGGGVRKKAGGQSAPAGLLQGPGGNGQNPISGIEGLLARGGSNA
jgi:hypothetical protein